MQQDQWLFGVAAILLAWINLVLMVRQGPVLGIYVVMFTDVLRTFSKFFVVFFLFIVAFAMAFFMLFQNQVNSFENYKFLLNWQISGTFLNFHFDTRQNVSDDGWRI